MFFKIEHHLLIQLICNHAGFKKNKTKKLLSVLYLNKFLWAAIFVSFVWS